MSALSEYGQWQAERDRHANSPRPKPYEVGAVVPVQSRGDKGKAILLFALATLAILVPVALFWGMTS